MPQTPELKHQIDELALRLVMGDPDPANASSCVQAIEQIRDTAARGQSPAVAATASALLAALPEAASLSGVLNDGIAALQRALEGAGSPAPPPTALSQDPELLSDFIVESRDHLANIENQLLILDRDPCDAESLNSAFRGFHTIKGLAGFLELWDVQKLAHEVEAVLDRARAGEMRLARENIDVILASADHLRQWLDHLQSTLQGAPSTPPAQPQDLLARIAQALRGGEAPAPASALAETSSPAPVPLDEPLAVERRSGTDRRSSEAMSIKVDTGKLDYLVDMAGEMVIAESLVRHDAEISALKNPLLQRKIGQLTRITAELQKTAMSMRLVPVGPQFRRMARLVRDLARQFGKQVEMETVGDDIELDRTIVEELADPLMHMVRNSMDHGIELPADRERAGKPAKATLRLKAVHQAGQVVIEITDDGRGLDREKILAKGIQKGLVASGDGMSDNDVFNLIFEPGFSTAAQVTSVSGRGVGMDVVRRHIEKLRGRIEIRSVLGQGATFQLKLPLTLAIIDGLVVGVGPERYIAPLFSVRELFRPNAETVWTVQGKAEMALVRGSLLPVIRLYRAFGVEPKSEDATAGVLIVAEVESRRFCLLVDEVIGKQEVVIKTLGAMFKNASGIAGGAILGDGRVGLILDLDRLFKDRTGATQN